MKLLNTYDTEATAYIDKGYLDSHGIPAFVDEDAMSTVFPAPDAGTSSIGLYVDDENYDRARLLMESRPILNET